MKIIISPAKKINDKNDFTYPLSALNLNDKTIKLYELLKSLSYDELRDVIKASDVIVSKTYHQLHQYKLEEGYLNAIFAYDGIQYQIMNPSVMDEDELLYLQNHLLIINGLYGYNYPFDLIIPHRLEMQTIINNKSLYDYWDDTIAKSIDGEIIINLASKEYSKAIIPYIKNKERIYTISFKEVNKDKLIEKGVYVKMARGAMVRYMADNMIDNIEDIKKFNDLNYQFSEEYSSKNHLIFIRKEGK